MTQIVREVMSSNLVTVGVEDSLIDASKARREHDIGDVVIVQDERLLGISPTETSSSADWPRGSRRTRPPRRSQPPR